LSEPAESPVPRRIVSIDTSNVSGLTEQRVIRVLPSDEFLRILAYRRAQFGSGLDVLIFQRPRDQRLATHFSPDLEWLLQFLLSMGGKQYRVETLPVLVSTDEPEAPAVTHGWFG
jgi:hypothetical protein